MPQQVIEVHPSITVMMKCTVETDIVVFSASFITGVVTSTLLPQRTCDILTQRLQTVMEAAPVIADLELGFAGLVESLLSVVKLEVDELALGTFAAGCAYTPPNAEYFVTNANVPCHLIFSIPFSTSSPVIGVT